MKKFLSRLHSDKKVITRQKNVTNFFESKMDLTRDFY